ncbi:TRAP transporter substrate-binding protein [Halomonas sp. MCCC 1A17488]|uniref:TRAP transporter substrate-binding protein n=1 Tax=Billgrantia sulfidoxydans TaxID=2733484 RepID=A0ABX7VYK3_9GAMM|nr:MULTISPECIES: TRAP transporter substrate-binding protein [Halomonas]MCE8017224.1 TRAP transporter substrate-binding protein [Halomonas sp. MCCC 1A17488]MCG3240557.1 TRAP transporter substrate-binding protein [Halomonas sp. MCCC 1A17488]QPP49589.1 TRAP transporter substrate-binding protein [Halomonas sp. SS10-MC5]QTP53225.1 TRAP transporter substrate-binding protein [Halomonas sulfidoxydans]
MKTISTNKTFCAIAVSAALAAMALPVQADTWRGWNIHPPGYPNTVALEAFAENVTERTEGRITAQVYNNGVLGDQPDAIEQTRSGVLNFANFNMGPMGPIVPETNVLSLPFIFRSVEHMHEVMDGEIGQQFADALAEKNLVALSWFDSGERSLYNTKRPVHMPEDMQGLKIRVMNNDLYVDMIEALGGNATPMAYGEVYQSLKTGVLDGAENNYPSFQSSNHYEAAEYYSLTEHLIIPECLCIAKASWEALSAEDQEIVREEAIKASQMQRELWVEGSEASRQVVLNAGVQINEVEDKAAFQQRMEPVYAGFIEENPDLESLVDAIRNSN